ncbi:inosine triphosphate pyrophosphatase [Echinococcus multilocularis]|uniref:Inosine triphosphate pyrophosphatase n=1 Tax=Echinococcus multilocularis TaxID=6211 RepID=A0A087VX64_ECHMU|nr:inosine triphosphate pyrophosphatase [Echinococcus multilocularis]
MAVINCGRVGCQFPIKSDRIVCCECSTAFHPECSDLCPEDYAAKCGKGDWYCAICTAATTPIGDCAIGVATAKRADAAPPPHLFPISYVTSNPNKLRETMAILGKEYVGMLRQVDVELAEYQGSSAEEIARVKCEQAARMVGGAVLVEDTCLAFDALKGLPGPYIKWFLRAVGPEGLRKMVEGFRSADDGEVRDGASAICTFAYTCGVEGEPVEVLQGVTRGRIVAPRGSGGFGWDCCFAPIEATEGQTYAEMSAEVKNSISHRCRAVAKLRGLLDRLRSSSSTTSS